MTVPDVKCNMSKPEYVGRDGLPPVRLATRSLMVQPQETRRHRLEERKIDG